MSIELPPSPSLEQLKKIAKEILRRHEQKDPDVLSILRLLPRFRGLSDEQILSADLALRETQQAVAMQYGYKNWNIFRNVIATVFTPDPALPPARYFRDYHWHHGIPAGDDPIDAPSAGEGYFKFITPNLRPRVEQYDARGAFVRVCFDPSQSDKHFRKLRWQEDDDHMGAVCLDADGRVIRYEKYQFLSHDEPSLVRAEIYTADGRLIEIHTPKRVEPDGQDILVTDALGKLKVILHHREMSKGRPVKITEEWNE